MNTQHNQILQALKEAGNEGINSFAYRTKWIQLPVRISELKKKNHVIISRRNKDTSVNYILVSSPVVKQQLSPILSHYSQVDRMTFTQHPGSEGECGACNSQPRQEAFL